MVRLGFFRICAMVVLLGLTSGQAGAQEVEDGTEAGSLGTAAPPAPGTETKLPVPRFVSLKTSEGNVRRGPSLEHRIDWVFTHRNMPLRITAEFGHWRRVEDNEGQGGWIHYSLLSGVRTVLVTEARTALHTSPDARSLVVALADQGVVGRLGACLADWCEIEAGREEGWVEKTRLWGVEAAEIRE